MTADYNAAMDTFGGPEKEDGFQCASHDAALTIKIGGTEGTEGTTSDSTAPSCSPEKKLKGTEGTPGLIGEPVDPLVEPPTEPTTPKVKHRPCYMTHDDFTTYGPPGLYLHGVRQRKDDDPEEFDQRICSPIYAEATTSDELGDNFGLMLRFRNPYGQWRQWAMPMRLLKGSGEEVRGELLDMGVRIEPDAAKVLHKWLMSREPRNRLIAASRIGWHLTPRGRAFVMPRETFGADDIIFQSETATHDNFTRRGSLQEWREEIGKLCSGSPLAVFAVSAALVGPLLELVHRQGSGYHFVGDSSSGKSTLLTVSASVWGSAEYIRTWRATGNGLEGVAAALNDTCLILDEIGEADPREVGSIVYALGNGTGKARANRSGKARKPHRWKVALLSSGERSLAAHMAEGGRKAKAGQGVRLLDIPAQRQHGVFDELHHLFDGRALSDHLKSAVTRQHGHLGPAFIEKLLADDRDLSAMLDEFLKVEGFDSKNGIEGRAAASLSLVGMAGELATEYGLTGWQEGEALDATIIAYQAWRDFRGDGQTETRQILQSVESFISRHGDSRFSSIDHDPQGLGSMSTWNRAGWWRDTREGRVYLFTADGLREALQGFDFKRGLAALDSMGWITDHDYGKRSKKARVDNNVKSLYFIQPTGEEV